MIDLNAMHVILSLLVLFLSAGSPSIVWPQAGAEIRIENLLPGDVLQGVVNIEGQAAAPGFSSYEVSFRYAHSNDGGWFLIAQNDQPVEDGTLAVWDTTLISDGDYDVRLLLLLMDGHQQEVVVEGVQVRNYTPVATLTGPGGSEEPLVSVTAAPEPSQTAILPTSTAFAANPGAISRADIYYNLARGVSFTALVFIFLWAYQAVRKRRRRR